MSKYFLKARLFPALLTAFPMLIFFNKIFNAKYHDALKNLYDALPVLSNLGLSASIIFLCVHINRFIAKEIFQRLYFKDDLYMPSTNHLLWKNDYYETETKKKIRQKICDKFGLFLLNQEEEILYQKKARKLIVAGVSQVKIMLAKNLMLLQHNIEYGFWRNFIGGSFLATVFSIITYFYSRMDNLQSLKTISIITFIIYLIPLIFSKKIINNLGAYYSKILYEQFLYC